jgi:hypothetical protein
MSSQSGNSQQYGQDTERFLVETPEMRPIVERLSLQIALAQQQIEQKHEEIQAITERNRLEHRRQQQHETDLAHAARRNQIEEDRNAAIAKILTIVENLSAQMQANLDACQTRLCTPDLLAIRETMQISIELIRMIAARVIGSEELSRMMRDAHRKSEIIVNAGTHVDVTGNVKNIVEGVQHAN